MSVIRRTGIFFYYQEGDRLRDFPRALAGVLSKDNVFFYDAYYPLKVPSLYELSPATDELLYKVHSNEMIDRLKELTDFPGALYSAGGTIQAGEKIRKGNIDNAFVFTGYGDHHAGRNFFGGGCYLNGAALSIANLRQKYSMSRFAIADTDPHHGDGTWDIFRNDKDVLYLCFCADNYTGENNKVNIQIPYSIKDKDYQQIVASALLERVPDFKPDLIFWNYGFDGTQGDYGSIGLSPDCHVGLAKIFREVAENYCQGRLAVVLCGGSRRHIATYTIPRIIDYLSS